MKNIVITLFFAGFMLLFDIHPAKAGGNNAEAALNEAVKTEITKHIPYPSFAKADELNAQVEILLHVTEDGKVQVVRVRSTETQFIAYIKRQLDGMPLDLPVNGENYLLTVRYELRG